MTLYGLEDDDVVISGVAMSIPGSRNFTDLASKLTSSFPIRAGVDPLPAGMFFISFVLLYFEDCRLHWGVAEFQQEACGQTHNGQYVFWCDKVQW